MFNTILNTIGRFFVGFGQHILNRKGQAVVASEAKAEQPVAAPKAPEPTIATNHPVIVFMGQPSGLIGKTAQDSASTAHRPAMLGPNPATTVNQSTPRATPQVFVRPHLEVPRGDYRPSWQGPRPK